MLKVQEKLNDQYANTVSATNDLANKWLTYQTIILSIFTVLLTIWWIYLGWLVNNRLSKIEDIKRQVDFLGKEIKETPEVLFYRLQNIENDYIFDRLENFDDRDIENFFSILTSRKLDSRYADNLINLYRKTSTAWGKGNSDDYFVLLVQHFPERVFLDNDLWIEFKNSFYGILNRYYTKEIAFVMSKISLTAEKSTWYFDRFKEFISIVNWISDSDKRGFCLSEIVRNLNEEEYKKYVEENMNNTPIV